MLFAMFCVPASAELSADTKVAFPHPFIYVNRLRIGKELDRGAIPVFCIVCKLAVGKTVIFPGVNVSLTTRAPFSSTIYVFVVPSIATTRFVARGW
jgi:hypothetical protein